MDKTRKPYPEKARERIRATQVIDKLRDHVLDGVEMSSTQVNAARILLNKALPDLKQTDSFVEHSSKPPEKMSRAELASKIAALWGDEPTAIGGSVQAGNC